MKYWCPHCDKVIEKRSNILPEGVCGCGHPHLCECHTVENYGREEYRQIASLLEDNALGMQADEVVVNLASDLSGKGILSEKEVESLFMPSPERLRAVGPWKGSIAEVLIHMLLKKEIITREEYWGILTPARKEPPGMSKRRITVSLLYLLKNRCVISREDFERVLEPTPRIGEDEF